MNEKIEKSGLIQLIKRGGVFSDLPGANPLEVLTGLIQTVPLPDGISREGLLKAVLEREALMPTAIGNGIALPHPRNPIITGPQDQFVVIGFPRQQVDWKALDGKPVHTLLLIVSSSAKLHLRTLSQISFFCHQETFRDLLQKQASQQHIIDVIQEAEGAWR
ncbi:MAG: PTS sugar transporter subunit IIA [Treponema sp.]|jgi:PTS system nitrogen regulatory IIA component|nr:PTS sugar transporter subunit IIA [Treponema sp.]